MINKFKINQHVKSDPEVYSYSWVGQITGIGVINNKFVYRISNLNNSFKEDELINLTEEEEKQFIEQKENILNI